MRHLRSKHSNNQRTIRGIVLAAVILMTLLPFSALAQTPVPDVTVTEGGTATFIYVDYYSIGTPVQWEVSTNGGSTWTSVSGSNYSGANTNTLTINNVPFSFNCYQYRFAIGIPIYALSNAATLYVNATQPRIISHPVDRTISEGSGTSFSITTSGGGQIAYQYQWQYSSDAGSTFSDVPNGGIYAGATTATLTLTNVPIGYSGYQYSCSVIAPDWNNWTDFSNAARLTVVGSPPIITTTSLPEGIRGTAYSVDLIATGTTPITWSIFAGSLPDGLSLNANTGRISGVPTTTGPLRFTVRASNRLGDDTKAFDVVITEPPLQTVIEVTSPTQPFCTVEDYLSIPFHLIENVHPVKYSIRFSDDAKAAGFRDITSFDNLPADMLLKIDVPEGVPSKLYAGVVIVQCEGIDNYKDEYPFTFSVANNGIVIVNQPPAFQSLCGGSSVALTVDISGNASSYQWYKNGQAIAGARSKEYMAETEGSYYVEMMGECGMLRSKVAVVAPPSSVLSGISVRVKWGNVLYVENAAEKYERYQWYHNGTAIQGATFVYLSEREGFLGEYYVRCYKSDESFDETCPIVFTTRTRSSSVGIYPTVVKTNDVLTITITDTDFDTDATVEIYSLLGVKVYSTKITTPVSTVRPDFRQKGNYLVKITLSSGEVLTEKIIVQ